MDHPALQYLQKTEQVHQSRSNKKLISVEQNDKNFKELLLGSSGFTSLQEGDDYYSNLGGSIAKNTSLTKLQINLSEAAPYIGLGVRGVGLDVTNSGFFCGIKQNSSIKKLHIINGTIVTGSVGYELLNAYQANNSNSDLTRLHIEACHLQNASYITNSTLRSCTALKEIALTNCTISDEQLLSIAESIRGRPLLEKLELHQNRIGTIGCKALATLLEDPNSNLTTLELFSNRINNDGASILANSLANNTKLRILNLFNNLFDVRVEEVFSELLCNKKSISSIYSSNHTLNNLVLHRRMGSLLSSLLTMNLEGTNKSRVAMRKTLKYHPILAKIDVSELFEWGEEGEQTLKSLPYILAWFDRAEDMEGRSGSYKLHKHKLSTIYKYAKAMSLSFIPTPHIRRVEQNDSTLTEIKIGGGVSSDAYTRYASSVGNEFDRLGTAIGKNSHLSDLHVSVAAPALDVSNQGFFEGLKRNSSICSLFLDGRIRNRRSPLVGGIIHEILNAYQENNNNLTRIRVKQAHLQNGGEQILSTTFGRCSNLIKIVLFDCNITDEQLLPMVDALIGHSTLKVLDFNRNRIGSIGCEALATLLSTGSNLSAIGLQSNNVNDEGVNILVNSLVGNTKLQQLILADNHIDPSLTRSVFSNLICNKSNINSIFSSNHTLSQLKLPESFPQQMKEELETLVKMNANANKSKVAMMKIINNHPNIEVSELFTWDKKGEQTLKSLPYMLAWFERAANTVATLKKKRARKSYQRKINRRELSAIYEYAKAMPLEFVSASHNIKVVDEHCQGKKRKRDD